MNITKNTQRGFHIIEILIAIVVIVLLGFVIWRFVISAGQDSQKSQSSGAESTAIAWGWNGEEWQAQGQAPDCKDPVKFTTTPADLSKATAVLYPGQTRGQYKPHGGFRFDGAKNDDITVKAIYDGYLTSGARYIEAGEVQYVLTFVNNCGIAYRLDHLATLAPAIQKVADTLPQAKVDDSRTTDFENPILVKTGEDIATAVGFKKTQNVSFDLGVYDYRKQNTAARSQAYKNAHKNELSQAAYAVCWLDMFPVEDSAIIKSLPAGDQAAGKTSDYCE